MAKKSPQPDDTPLSKRLRELAEKANLTRDQLMRMSLLPTDKEPTIMEMVAEGNALIEADEAKHIQEQFDTMEKLQMEQTLKSLRFPLKKHSDAPAQEKTPLKKTQSDNPYFQARMTVLEKYPEWRRNEIGRMEKEGDINNRFYAAFVSQVEELGDKLSS